MKKKTPYWLDFLRHPKHKNALLLGIGACVAASLPWGGDALILGFLALAAVDTVALAIVPSLPPFQAWADRQERNQALTEMRERLIAEIKDLGGSKHLDSFIRMTERVTSLYRMADDPNSTLAPHDVAQLEDASMDYLRLCLSDAVTKDSQRKGADTASAIEAKLSEVRITLDQGALSAQEAQQMRRAEGEFVQALARHSRMASRKAVIEASLLSMPVRMEEVYQMVMTAPRAGNLGSLLEESLSRLRITEEVSIELDQELGLEPSSSRASVTAVPAVPQRMVNTIRH